jgi:hypothetical protein
VYNNPVNIAIARLLGPACEISAELVRGEVSKRADRVIVRPQQVRFVPSDSGDARVIGCHFTGGFWQIEAELPQCAHALASSPAPIAIGTTGSLQWVSG